MNSPATTSSRTALPDIAPIARGLDLEMLRERLAACGYTQALLSQTESVLRLPIEAARLPIVQWLLARWPEPGAVLARLWAYDDVVERDRLEAVLGQELVASLAACGVLVRDGDRIRSTLRLLPFRDLWLFSDHPHAGTDAVMGPGGTTGETAGLLPDRIEGTFLDLGCGAGSLALLAARRGARDVMGADINPRAIEMSRLNATLNRLSATFEAGDLFEPAGSRRFDWIVSQPPYVMEPEGTPRVTYLHGGAGGADVSARLLSEVTSRLAPGAHAIILLDAPLDGAPLEARFRRLVQEDHVDLVVLAAPGLSPELQSMAYATYEDPFIGPAYAAATRRYLEHFAARGIAEFRHVALLIRRQGVMPDHALTALVPVHDLPHYGGRSALSLLEALDMAALPEDRLLREALSPSPWAHYRIDRRTPFLEEEGDHSVRFDPGSLGVNQEMSAASMLLLSLVGDAPDLATAVERYAEHVEGESAELTPPVVEFVRRALGTGILVPRELDQTREQPARD